MGKTRIIVINERTDCACWLYDRANVHKMYDEWLISVFFSTQSITRRHYTFIYTGRPNANYGNKARSHLALAGIATIRMPVWQHRTVQILTGDTDPQIFPFSEEPGAPLSNKMLAYLGATRESLLTHCVRRRVWQTDRPRCASVPPKSCCVFQNASHSSVNLLQRLSIRLI